jgi:1-acyl-sn-glycerol-3-phosphate acyltransferase
MIRYTLKLIVLVVSIGGYVLTSYFIAGLTRDRQLRRRRLSRNICRWARLGLVILGIKLEKVGSYDSSIFKQKNFLVLSNHLSYTDVMILAASFPSVFVTSVEVRDSIFVGLMSALGGSIFIERRNRENIENEIAEITRALDDGLNVVIFPEATSTNGETVLPFKRSLLKSAIDAKVDVLPMAISYPRVNGKLITPEERDMVCYYGEKEFFEHLKKILSLHTLTARLQYMPEMPIHEMPDRKAIADRAYEEIHRAYTNTAYL